MNARQMLLSGLFAVFIPMAGQAQTIDEDPIEAGREVFRRCAGCHSFLPGENKTGPSFFGLFGSKAGSVEGYDYSDALRNSEIVWTPETLDTFLAAPFRVVPGMKMLYGGVQRATDRAHLIAFLGDVLEAPPADVAALLAQAAETTASEDSGADLREASIDGAYTPDVRYTLRTGIADGRMVYIGVGGTIEGVVNPVLRTTVGDIVQISLINGEGAIHDIAIEELGIRSQRVLGTGAGTTIAFQVSEVGTITYFCTLPGHREAGMVGELVVSEPAPPEEMAVPDTIVSLDPTHLPGPVNWQEPRRIEVELEAVELVGLLDDGTTYEYWTFNGTVPGPMLRVRVGDTVVVTLSNHHDSSMVHSVDFHAATGPGGGAAHTQADPGEAKMIEFKALKPGLYVYHCATPMVAHHITNGMYGMILVEPEGGLPRVDHEFYVMQGELYTHEPFGQSGLQEFSIEKLLAEQAEYVVFNGTVNALTTEHPMQVNVGESVRMFFGVGGPNYTSSFHVIGEIFDRVYAWGDLVTPPNEAVQTVLVPPGGAVVTEFALDVPGRYLLVDHALSRLERGLVGFLVAEGEENPDIYKAHSPADEGSGH
ncbi:MAG: copper-containing nitrite reductase [Dongiaceae bacterium]